MPVKKWVPTDYLDETAPKPRDTPSDWLIRLADGRIALDANDITPDAQPRPLADGEIVLMSWVEHHGTGFVTLDAVDKSIIALPDMPPDPPGGTMLCVGDDPEAVAWDLKSLTAEWDAGDSDSVTYYAWSDLGSPYILVGGKLEPVEPSTVARCGILAEIVAERARQDAKWGGPAHDDTHTPSDWYQYLSQQVAWLVRRPGIDETQMEDYRQRLIKIAALAVAAIESYDRRHAAPPEPSALDLIVAIARAKVIVALGGDAQPGESGEVTDQAALDAWTRSGWSDLAKAED